MGAPLSAEPLSQRRLALELRYLIDVARYAEDRPISPVDDHVGRVRELVGQHPQAMRSAHVRHNLGVARMRWLREKELDEA